jgi:translocation and assembly module TamA
MRLARALMAVAVAAPVLAFSQQANYRIEIDAPQELVESLRTQTLLGRWRTDPEFEPTQLPLFIERVREEALSIAQTNGYFSARVTVTQRDGAPGATTAPAATAAPPDSAGASPPPTTRGSAETRLPTVRIEIDAGARTTVNRVRLALQGDAARDGLEAAFVQRWPLPEGTFFRTEPWELGKRMLIEFLQQRGYLRASIARSNADIDPAATTASLDLVVESGPRLNFGESTIRGLSRYPRSLVDALHPWDPGDPYSVEKVQTFVDRLRSEGHFSSVTVLPDLVAVEADPQRMDVPMNVEVRERSAKYLTAGLGFSTDQGLRALAGYTQRNLFDRGWTLDSGALVESVRRRVFVNGMTPYDGNGHRWQTGLRYEVTDISGQITSTNTAYFGRGRRSDQIEHFVSLQYQLEHSSIAADPEPITEQAQALTLGYAWLLRRVDSRIDPRDGYTVSAQVSGAVEGLATDRSFVRFYGRFMKFVSMPRDSALAGGLLVGLLETGWVVSDSRSGIPSDNLFRTGGAQSIRGYSYQSLGVPQGNAIVGGRVLGLASLEYQHPIRGDWFGAAFVDVGNAADAWSSYKAVSGTGVGLRWRSPVGPINLDVAYGADVKEWRAHFSVGFAF